MLKKFLFLFILIFTAHSSKAENLCFNSLLYAKYEKASLDFLDGTSIIGLGKIVSGNNIKFKVDEESKADIWTSELVKGITFIYNTRDYVFEYVQVNQGSVALLEVIEKGHVSLYINTSEGWVFPVNFDNQTFGRSPYKEKNTTFYVKKSTEKSATLLSVRFRKRAKEYFKDCEGIIENIDSKKFNKYNIPKMVYYYNDFCVD